VFQGPRVHFQLDAGEAEQQILEMVTPSVKVPSAGMKSPLKSYSTAEMKTTIGLNNDVHKTHAVSDVYLEKVSQTGGSTLHGVILSSYVIFKVCVCVCV
jgi:hypothetical protein